MPSSAPAQDKDGRIRLTILGGYLGSGKTTWLRHQLYQGALGQVHVLVNEAAETPVDDTLLQERASDMTLLAGGCACCVGKDDLLGTLRRLCDERSQTASHNSRLERIILETSGLADPATIVMAISTDPVLVHHILLEDTLVMVDAVNILDHIGTEHLGRAQIEAADQIIISKADLQTPAALSTVRATLAALNPGATITTAVKGDAIALDYDLDAAPAELPTLDTTTPPEPIRPHRLYIDEGVDWPAFSVWLSALLHARGRDIVRVKGVFATPAGPLLLQGVCHTVQAPEVLPPSAQANHNQIVFIGRRFDTAELRASLTYFSRG